MSWGYKIAILYISFVIVILTGVIASTFQDYHLVQKDYYEAEIAYEDRIQEINNFKALIEKPSIQLAKTKLNLHFPQGLQQAQGMIHFYRPSDSELDLKFPLELQNGLQGIPTSGLKRGNWIVKLSYVAAGQAFYQEQSIVMP